MNIQKNFTPRFINLSEVKDRVCLSKTTLLTWEAQGKFPRAVRLSSTKRLWLESDVNSWMLEKHATQTNNGEI